MVFKIAKTKSCHSVNHSRKSFVFFLNGIAKAVGGSVEIGKQSFNVSLRGVAISRAFDS